MELDRDREAQALGLPSFTGITDEHGKPLAVYVYAEPLEAPTEVPE